MRPPKPPPADGGPPLPAALVDRDHSPSTRRLCSSRISSAMLHELEHLPKHITNYIQQPPKCPLLALSGHPDTHNQCLLLG